MGGWVGEIKIKDQLSPVETEIRAELGNISDLFIAFVQAKISPIEMRLVLQDMMPC